MALDRICKNDVLKAEIATLLFNLGKTHIGVWEKKKGKAGGIYFSIDETQFQNVYGYNVFGTYAEYFTKQDRFKKDVRKIADGKDELWNFFNNNKINVEKESATLLDVMKSRESNSDFVKKVMFHGCENINSGIDKGAPIEQIKASLYISNAFGTEQKLISEDNLDSRRLSFFSQLHDQCKGKGWYQNPDWKAVRDYVIKELQDWYSELISDTRFPVNDVTLWDQVYMTASMFKATLANIYIDNSLLDKYKKNPSKIEWQIFGVQYDKLKLAEKGMKPAHIQWYRDKCVEADDKTKAYMETELCLANEIYRDETGVYFLFPSGLSKKPSKGVAELENVNVLGNDYSDIEEQINTIFSDVFDGEVQPVYFLTEASRGTMNLPHLLKNAKKLFLYAPMFEDEKESAEAKMKVSRNQVCPVCRIRQVTDKEQEPKLCNVCDERRKNRLEDWLLNTEGETIWLDEIQDREGRIALVTLRFELMEWLNGNMVSTALNRTEDFQDSYNKLNKLLHDIANSMKGKTEWKDKLDGFKKDHFESIKTDFIIFFDKDSIQTIYNKINSLMPQKNSMKKSEFIDSVKNDDKKVAHIRMIDWFFEQIQITYEKYFDSKDVIRKDDLLNVATYAFLSHQICQILFDRSAGSDWEKLLNAIIPEDSRKGKLIDWGTLDKKQIDDFTAILLQFLLRKNPSPARLRRIWESTEQFMSGIKEKVIGFLVGKRLVFSVQPKNTLKNGEYESHGLLFWVVNQEAYSLAPLEKALQAKIVSLTDKEMDTLLESGSIEIANKELTFKNTDNEPVASDKDKFITVELKKITLEEYQNIFSILDPTPISWQFIVPASKVNDIVEIIQTKYKKEFRYVYGKLPLHIGIVVQNYKSPLYGGLKALRNIRRELGSVEDIKQSYNDEKLKNIHQNMHSNASSNELANNTEEHYSLYERKDNGDYTFYFPSTKKPKTEPKTLSLMSESNTYNLYPNTIDFEYLDSNVRRNDIFYDKNYKRADAWRNKRPYTWEEWELCKSFGELFQSNEQSSSQLNNLVTRLYSLIEDWKGNDESITTMAASTIINTLGQSFNNKDDKDKIEKWDLIPKKITKNSIERFIDYYDYWHNTLKII